MAGLSQLLLTLQKSLTNAHGSDLGGFTEQAIFFYRVFIIHILLEF